MNVILAIKPKYIDLMEQGVKKYEFRKLKFHRWDINKVFLYATTPIKGIVGVFKIAEIIEDNIENLWNKYGEYSGLSNKEFFNYYSSSDRGIAIKLKDFKKFNKIIRLELFPEPIKPPQSFTYTRIDVESYFG